MNNSIKSFVLILTLGLLQACQSPSEKPQINQPLWQLQIDQSELNFTSTKNESISESHAIKFSKGEVNSLLLAELILDLNQVETQIPIRNQRIKDILFETDKFPQASIKAQLNKTLPFNTPFDIAFELNLHGIVKELSAQVMIQINEEGPKSEMVVTTYTPVLIHAKDFGLDAGINQLTQIAKLKAISYEVPVDFKLVFHKKLIQNKL